MSGPSRAKQVVFTLVIAGTLGLSAAVMIYRLALNHAYVRFSRAQAPPPAVFMLPARTPEATRGEALIAQMGCADCHGTQLRGSVVADEPGRYRIVAPDLMGNENVDDATRWLQWWHALRLGLDGDQRALWAMPRTALLQLAQDDVAALCDALLLRRRSARARAHAPVRWPNSFVTGRGYLELVFGSLVLVDDAVPAPPATGFVQTPPAPDDVQARADYERRIRYRGRASAHAAAAHLP